MEFGNTYLLVKRSLLIRVACFLLPQIAYCAEVASTKPSQEQVYSFIAPETGFYNMEVMDADSEVAYAWKLAYSSFPGCQYIGTISGVGENENMYWINDSIYYFYLDYVDLSADTHQLYMPYLDPVPDLEYYSHQIDDDQMAPSSGDNDGLAEPGESIELYLSLRNTGTGDAHNVSASLSTSNSSISISNAGGTWGDIPSGTSDQSSGAFSLDIAAECREGEVNFVLNITSDEGSWTDQFQLYVYAAPNSISDEPFSAAIELFPNPAGKALFLKSTVEIDTPVEIRILDGRGATLRIQDLPSMIRGEIIELDLSELDPGIYFLHLRHSDFTQSRKIVIE